MFGFGIGEWLLVGLIALILFGPAFFKRAALSLGRGLKSFRSSLEEGEKVEQDAKESRVEESRVEE